MKKKMIVLILTFFIALGVAPISLNAASSTRQSARWSINYAPYAPSSDSVQTVRVTMYYYSGGYYAYCSSFSGVNGSKLTITSTDNIIDREGGKVEITSTGRTTSWVMKYFSGRNVNFKLFAETGFRCNASGEILLN